MLRPISTRFASIMSMPCWSSTQAGYCSSLDAIVCSFDWPLYSALVAVATRGLPGRNATGSVAGSMFSTGSASNPRSGASPFATTRTGCAWWSMARICRISVSRRASMSPCGCTLQLSNVAAASSARAPWDESDFGFMRWFALTPLMMLPIAAHAEDQPDCSVLAIQRGGTDMIRFHAAPRPNSVTHVNYRGTRTRSLAGAIDGDFRPRHRSNQSHLGIAGRRAGAGARRVRYGRGDRRQCGAGRGRARELRTGGRSLRHLSRREDGRADWDQRERVGTEGPQH